MLGEGRGTARSGDLTRELGFSISSPGNERHKSSEAIGASFYPPGSPAVIRKESQAETLGENGG